MGNKRGLFLELCHCCKHESHGKHADGKRTETGWAHLFKLVLFGPQTDHRPPVHHFNDVCHVNVVVQFNDFLHPLEIRHAVIREQDHVYIISHILLLTKKIINKLYVLDGQVQIASSYCSFSLSFTHVKIPWFSGWGSGKPGPVSEWHFVFPENVAQSDVLPHQSSRNKYQPCLLYRFCLKHI